jgi:hypothetical protein
MPLKVLLIDPNAAASSLVHRTLAREGYEVATAESLDEGLTAFSDHAADLVLLSTEAGAEALEGWWQRAGETLGQVPVLLIGGGAEGAVPSAGTVGTPIDADDLLDKVRGQVGAPEAQGNLAWLPEALKEASDEIAEMEKMLGWNAADAPEPGAEADPVSLGIFTEEEAHPEGAAPEPDAAEAAEAVAEGTDRIGEEAAPTTAAVSKGARPAPEAAPEGAPEAAPARDGAVSVAGLPPEQVQRIVADLAREAVERVVWETVPAMVARFISESRAEQDKLFSRIVERVVWETIPEIAEVQVKAEIRRISDGDA